VRTGVRHCHYTYSGKNYFATDNLGGISYAVKIMFFLTLRTEKSIFAASCFFIISFQKIVEDILL
jgi:hypothetical protein